MRPRIFFNVFIAALVTYFLWIILFDHSADEEPEEVVRVYGKTERNDDYAQIENELEMMEFLTQNEMEEEMQQEEEEELLNRMQEESNNLKTASMSDELEERTTNIQAVTAQTQTNSTENESGKNINVKAGPGNTTESQDKKLGKVNEPTTPIQQTNESVATTSPSSPTTSSDVTPTKPMESLGTVPTPVQQMTESVAKTSPPSPTISSEVTQTSISESVGKVKEVPTLVQQNENVTKLSPVSSTITSEVTPNKTLDSTGKYNELQKENVSIQRNSIVKEKPVAEVSSSTTLHSIGNQGGSTVVAGNSSSSPV